MTSLALKRHFEVHYLWHPLQSCSLSLSRRQINISTIGISWITRRMARFRNWGKSVFQTRLFNGTKNVRCVQEQEAEAVKDQEIKKSKSEDEGRNPIYGREFFRIS